MTIANQPSVLNGRVFFTVSGSMGEENQSVMSNENMSFNSGNWWAEDAYSSGTTPNSSSDSHGALDSNASSSLIDHHADSDSLFDHTYQNSDASNGVVFLVEPESLFPAPSYQEPARDEQPIFPSSPAWIEPPAAENEPKALSPEPANTVDDSYLPSSCTNSTSVESEPFIIDLPARAYRHAQSATPTGVEADPRFSKLMTAMQYGAWAEALEMVRSLKTQYPNDPILEGLLNEAELKTELVTQWTGKVRGRRLSVTHERILRRSLPFILLLLLFVSGWVFYQFMIAPSRQVVALAKTHQQLIAQAQIDFQAGRYQEAVSLYNSVLLNDPNNQLALQGRAEARQQFILATEYELAMRVAQTGNVARAILMLQTLNSKAPHYRDVEPQIQRFSAQVEIQRAFQTAEEAYMQQRWLDAIVLYEKLRDLDATYQAEAVAQKLPEVYLKAAQIILSTWPSDTVGPQQTRTYLQEAQAAPAFASAASSELALLELYFSGERAQRNDNLQETITIWRGLYDQRPDYLGGYLAEELHRAYLTAAGRAQQQGDTALADEMNRKAAELTLISH